MTENSVDIIIIGLNEEKYLEKCITSCFNACVYYERIMKQVPRIIYVDSNSTDKSREIAAKFNLEIFIIKEKPNASAARHEGFRYSNSEYVFFIDGDMEVNQTWLFESVNFLMNNNQIAGVAGILDWQFENNERISLIKNYNRIISPVQKVNTDLGGAFVYRSSVLRNIGDFDPTLICFEEYELFLRFTYEGYLLVYINKPMVLHHDQKSSSKLSFVRKSLFTNKIFIPGIVIRKANKNINVYKVLLNKYWIMFIHILFFVLFVSTSIEGIRNNNKSLLCFSIIILFFWFTLHIVNKQNVERGLLSFFTTNIYIFGLIVGGIVNFPDIGDFYSKYWNKSK